MLKMESFLGLTQILFGFSVCCNIYFVVFWGARFLGQDVKKGLFGQKTRHRQFGPITEKFIFYYLVCFFVLSYCLLYIFLDG